MSLSEEQEFRAKKERDGLDDIEFTGRYKIGTSELFEYRATRNGQRVRGAGDTESEVSYDDGDPRFCLPSIYFLIGKESIQSMREPWRLAKRL